MPLSPQHKERSREKILNSAVKLFTGKGFENTSIDQVMQDAELTRGAFYAHFSSKSELYREAILKASLSGRLAKSRPDAVEPQDWLQTLVDGYLSVNHIKRDGAPCPLASMVTDVTVREPAVRATYTRVFKNMNRLLARYAAANGKKDTEQMLAVTALMIGGVAVGRALNDKAMAERLLESCRSAAKTLLEPD